ncbi:uncharacterized protein LOC135471053 [Liolophura sinensis]|uniref:uncharacterized protein LOC135471053 n=1 Tax=Liolophura sinensis TaxID=3198878 RepID=UPI0031597720
MKPLDKAPKGLQGMLLRAQQYDNEVHYFKGKEMYIADMLSRAFLPKSGNSQSEFETVNMMSFLPIREERLRQIHIATENDEVLRQVKDIILRGWPEKKDRLPVQLNPYFHIRDELMAQNGLLFKGERLFIPISLPSNIIKVIHSSHISTDGCLRRAHKCVFWPGMSTELREYISTFETCRKFDMNEPKETHLSHDLPGRPWQKIGTDLSGTQDAFCPLWYSM